MTLSGRQLVSFDVGAGEEFEVPLTAKKPSTQNYQLTTQEIKDLEIYCDKTLAVSSCIQLCSIERKLDGKTHVWKSQMLDSAQNNRVSSVVQVCLKDTKSIGRIVHFLNLQELQKNREFATVQIFKQCQKDPDSCLYYVDTSSFNVRTVPFECLSCPLVTAPNDEEGSFLWLLNI